MKYRSTFLFKLLVLIGAAVIFIGVALPLVLFVFKAVGYFSLPAALLFVGVILAAWFIGIEGGVVVTLSERLMLRLFGRLKRNPPAWLFYLDDKEKQAWARHMRDTIDNPTIR